ncbi:hypothetical protein GUITHDRAFT_145364 [Guillardia theta CCMP2712]|uniref:Pseudouridine synthase RsuA/RluA-like domain-containing protein n=1 Tax=Guillardia theta (strain CCMP2712) TaxID=905079 RepID=L1IMI1_GUITC|nr:hypothetical protein GUITHDRAFT_145364 [Guillardia theta CCMP2712]EKX37015.1 hypothetical protein GUITHDRAFT_145364 [Guillardia theta CCMP2712]|eukprot:XP_005823995.1 hypothetical protein GUITHDRAFT_145364 [Guillardia theta CCMP2712]
MAEGPEQVKHVRAEQDGALAEVVSKSLGASMQHATELIRLGAVYVDRVRATMDGEEEVLVKKDAYVRIHSRLDVPTHGLLVLGKRSEFVSRFNRLLREHQEYKALVLGHPPLGELVHYMEPSKRSPKVLDTAAREGWLECRLVVKSASRRETASLSERAASVLQQQSRVRDEKQADAEEDKSPLEVYEVRIELITGRTHQIRAQMAFAGCPVVGDEMYGIGGSSGDLLQEETRREFSMDVEAKTRARTMEARQAEGTLALQACRLVLPDMMGKGVSEERGDSKRRKCERSEDKDAKPDGEAEEGTRSPSLSGQQIFELKLAWWDQEKLQE